MASGVEAHRDELLLLSGRFRRAVSGSFAFSSELGFLACPAEFVDLDDLRNAMATQRYTRSRTAIEITFSLLTRQVSVVLLSYARPQAVKSAWASAAR